MTSNVGSESRKLYRESVLQDVAVEDALNGKQYGKVVNLHEEGFMLMGEEPVNEGGVYQLNFKFSSPINGTLQVTLGAECLWLNAIAESASHWAGFHIIDLGETERRVIECIATRQD